MADDDIKKLIESIGQHAMETGENAGGTVAVLISETTKLRDKLKKEQDYILTVEDTRRALDGLEAYLHKEPIPDDLTDVQKELAELFIERLTVM